MGVVLLTGRVPEDPEAVDARVHGSADEAGRGGGDGFEEVDHLGGDLLAGHDVGYPWRIGGQRVRGDPAHGLGCGHELSGGEVPLPRAHAHPSRSGQLREVHLRVSFRGFGPTLRRCNDLDKGGEDGVDVGRLAGADDGDERGVGRHLEVHIVLGHQPVADPMGADAGAGEVDGYTEEIGLGDVGEVAEALADVGEALIGLDQLAEADRRVDRPADPVFTRGQGAPSDVERAHEQRRGGGRGRHRQRAGDERFEHLGEGSFAEVEASPIE